MSRTLPHAIARLPVRSLAVDVVAGPDAGRTTAAASERLGVGTAEDNELVLTDPTVSRYHAGLTCRDDGILVEDHGSTNGTLAGGVRLERAVVPPGSLLRLGRTELRVRAGDRVDVELYDGDDMTGLLGASAAMRRVMARIDRVARSQASVLITGESGVGKERVARAIHDQSDRAGQPFVTVDCGALSPTLVQSELFGHERGAFTGAERQRAGAFEQAQGGTIFLDEIGDLPASLQPMLLGVLERRVFKRVGGQSETATNVRVIGATHRDLRAAVNGGSFRLDLYYRLATVVIDIPPLRERTDDVRILVRHFLREAGHGGAIEEVVAPATLEAMERYGWPGNVRELRNAIESMLLVGEAPCFEAEPAPEEPHELGRFFDQLAALTYKAARGQLLERFETHYLKNLLERTQHNISRAAREARMDRSYLIDLLRRHGLRRGV